MDSIKRNGGRDDFPTFEVRGNFDGNPFVYDVSIELEGNGIDMAPREGTNDFLNYGATDDPDPLTGISFDDRTGMQEEVFEAIDDFLFNEGVAGSP